MLLSIILLVLVNPSLATLKVLSPPFLAKDVGDSENSKTLNYTLSQFGSIMYGMSVFGYVHFDEKSPDACKEVLIKPYSENDINPILIARRGECTFFIKALNAYKAGAKVLVIVDNKDEPLDFEPVAATSGASVQIASMVIHMNAGEKIIRFVTKSNKDSKSPKAVLSFTNPLERKSVVDFNMILSSDDITSYSFLSEFNEMADSLSSNVNYTFSFMAYECEGCSNITIQNNCGDKEGKYCKLTRKLIVNYSKK